TYDRDDRLVSVGYPSGRIVEYERDQTGRIIRVQSRTDATSAPMPLASEIAYEPFGPLAGLTYGNGHTTSIGYDQAYRIETIDTLAGSAVVQDWSFGRDPVGNITDWSDDAVGSRSQSLSYDALYRLDTAQSQYGVMDFDYDANGNRKNKLEGAAATTYSYTPATNRLVGIDDATKRWKLAYDDAGNLISKLDAAGEGWLYGYSAGNRLASVSARELKFPDNGRKPPTEQDTVLATYTYDAFGQRIAATRNARTTLYIYGLNGALLTEVDSDLSRFRDYVYLEARAIAVQDLEAVTTSPPPTPVEVIVDNGDPGTLTTGAWSTLKNPKDFGTSYLLANGASGSTHFWFPSLAAGEYEVSAWWVSKNQYAPNVPYLINHDGQQTIVTVDQSGAGGQWNPLGTFTFDGSGSENVVVSDSAGKTTADAVRFVEVVSPTIETIETTHFVHADHLATPRAVTNQAGELVWSWFSTPFGNSLPDEDVDGDGTNFELNLRFPGQQYDAESGLHYNHFRDYDPATGRYIESDPVGLHGGLNAFAYAEGNPLYWSDNLGLYTLRQAVRSLEARGINRLGRAGRNGRTYTDQQVFDEWVRLELEDQSWLDELPACPETLPCEDDTWQEATRANTFHPGATWEVRSSPSPGNHSSQCMYDDLRQLIRTSRPAAGTADFGACPYPPFCPTHIGHDVKPYDAAVELGRISDYYLVRPTM
ncbi:MAG: golvesin C-terminal-like domain-containing protein, partial [Gammaproteobacteria bacterium]